MKKKNNEMGGIALIIVIIIITIICILTIAVGAYIYKLNIKNTLEEDNNVSVQNNNVSVRENSIPVQNTKYEDYYKITYSANYNTYNILDNNKDYEVVKDKIQLNKILNKISNNDYNNIFDNNFFNSKNLIVVQAGIDTKINKLDISNKKADIEIYHASPMTTMEKIWEYHIYLIPIDKEVNDFNVETNTYPDRMY